MGDHEAGAAERAADTVRKDGPRSPAPSDLAAIDGHEASAPSMPSAYAWTMLALGAVVVIIVVRTRILALPASEPPAAPAPAVTAGLFAAMIVLGPLGAAIGVALAGAPADGARSLRSMAIISICAYAAQIPAAAAYVWLRRRATPRGAGPVLAAAAIGIALLVGVWPLVVVVAEFGAALQHLLSGQALDPLAHETLRALRDAPDGPWPTVVTALAILAAPIAEEILYRGMGQSIARNAGFRPWTAIVLVSAFFAIMHAAVVPVPALAGLFVLALGLGWAREATGGLTAPIVAHVGFNAANLMIASGMTR